MHIEILVEDSSGAAMLEVLVPQFIGDHGNPHTWRIISYRGVGHVPKDLKPNQDPAKRALLNQLPRLLSGYGRTPGIGAVVVIADSDRRDCRQFLQELQTLLQQCNPIPNTLFRLAIEEMEAWYLGIDRLYWRLIPRPKKMC